MAGLARYHDKRDFDQTPEPSDPGVASTLALRYAMQKHAATRLHFDLRLEWQGVLLSWAVTRGPSLNPADKRLAVRTEDHPLSYIDFEGNIPKGNYGAGTVMLWDSGWWQPLLDIDKGLRDGKLHFALHGYRMTGNWKLVRMKAKPAEKSRENWLLLKEDDAVADPARDLVARHGVSIGSGRRMEDIVQDAPPQPLGPPRGKAAPPFRKPQLATRTSATPEGAAWWHELKLDGYRATISLGKGGARVFTRNGHDWSDRFAALLPAFAELPAQTALIDGEIVAGAGLHGFSALKAAITAGGPFRFYAFDLLHLDGRDIASAPLTTRRKALERLFGDVPPEGALQLSPFAEGDLDAVWDAVCKTGGEGLIAKLRDAPYRSGRGTAWLKIKCEQGDEFVICGYQRSDKRGRAFASLLLATQEDDGLVYRGKVGTGFDEATQDALATKMAALAQKQMPLAQRPDDVGPASKVQWLTPSLVAEIRYAEITPEGRLRHASFVALREDKPAREVRFDDAPARPKAGHDPTRPVVAGVGISSGDRVIFGRPRLTKLGLAEYYEAVAARMLVTAADRPLSLVRLPTGLDGERFFQKHLGKGWPEAIRTVKVPEKNGGTADYMAVNTASGLVGAVQMGTVEFHIWGARRDKLEKPDRMVFDLDPDEGMRFARVRQAAADIAADLAALGFESWPLLTGGKGVHVVVPLRRVADWETVKLFARTFATLQAERDPNRFLATMSKAKRKGRIFIDYLRNERGATAIAPFSVRARPGAPVAVPVTWDELHSLPRANLFSVRDAVTRTWDDAEVPPPTAITAAAVRRLAAFAEG
jgi:bifunctional non-homologous end joining protein LigD